MKTKSIRISESQEQHLLAKYKNVNQGIQECIHKDQFPDRDAETLKYIRGYSKKELKGKFSREEWMFFLDSLNGSITEGMFRCNSGALIYHSQDAEEFDGTATKWNVDLPALIAKIQLLTGAQVDSLYTFVEEFWEKEDRDLEKTATELI
ncbi:MAG: hypothetical protein U1D64_05185 [Bacteroidales bacterium]|nr:hypothetical protein [Bacteroidales bacterium]